MLTSDIIQLTLLIVTALGTCTSIWISISTLRQNSKMIEDNSRAYIIFYIDYHPQTNKYYLVIKNFGNSIGKLDYVRVTPKLDWKKAKSNIELHALTDSTNVLLAPGQKISSWFDFDEYPDKVFDVELVYETMNKSYTENYKIDLSYLNNFEWLHNYAFDDLSKDNKQVLYKINNSILEISDRLN